MTLRIQHVAFDGTRCCGLCHGVNCEKRQAHRKNEHQNFSHLLFPFFEAKIGFELIKFNSSANRSGRLDQPNHS
jgi:hypothetical protein